MLLLDKPLSNLNAKLREEPRICLGTIIDRHQLTVVCVTHDQVEALTLANRILLMDGGRVVQEGSPESICDDPKSLFVAEFMGTNNRFDVQVVGRRDVHLHLRAANGIELVGTDRRATKEASTATAVVRTELISFAPDPCESRFQATLEMCVYMGDRWNIASVQVRSPCAASALNRFR